MNSIFSKKTKTEENTIDNIASLSHTNHVHMFVAIPPKLAVSKYMGILNGKSSLIIFQRWSNLKYKFFYIFTICFTIKSAKTAYPLVGLFTKTCVTAPQNFLF